MVSKIWGFIASRIWRHRDFSATGRCMQFFDWRFWKGDPDFISVLHCNYTSIVHRASCRYEPGPGTYALGIWTRTSDNLHDMRNVIWDIVWFNIEVNLIADSRIRYVTYL